MKKFLLYCLLSLAGGALGGSIAAVIRSAHKDAPLVDYVRAHRAEARP